MMKGSNRLNSRVPLVGDMLCSLLTLPTGLKWVYEGFDEARGVIMMEYVVAALLFMGLARLFRAFRLREKTGWTSTGS